MRKAKNIIAIRGSSRPKKLKFPFKPADSGEYVLPDTPEVRKTLSQRFVYIVKLIFNAN